MLDDTLGKIHFWMTFLGTYAIYFPMHYLGFEGVPRRYYAYGETAFMSGSAQDLNAAISVAAIFVAVAQVIFILNVVKSLFDGKKAGHNPWQATSLEWQTPHTPPRHGNFDELPSVYRWAYDYGVPGAERDFIPQNVPSEDMAGAQSKS